MKPLAIVFAGLTLLATAPLAAQVLPKEPARGALRYGQKVLVENRRCPTGQVMEVSGGRIPNRGTNLQGTPTPRERRCVPRP